MSKKETKGIYSCKEGLSWKIWKEWGEFRKEFKNIFWILGIIIFLVYGIRIVNDNFFIDSEIMILRPEHMHYDVWVGSNRFGLALTSWLFGMGRLVPWISNCLMALMMWTAGIILAFFSYRWVGHNLCYRNFVYLFPAFFVSAPILAEQFLFVLQAFEVAFAMALCIMTAGIADAVVCSHSIKREFRWLLVVIVGIVWSIGSYQSFALVYITLVLIAFVLRCANGNINGVLEYGIKHVLIFAIGFLGYCITAVIVKEVRGIESTYISNMILWKSASIEDCLFNIKYDMRRILKGRDYVFYSKLYTPAMVLFAIRCMYQGWKSKKSLKEYMLFLFGIGCLLMSPFILTVLTGNIQAARSQLVYPLTSALFYSVLSILPESGKAKRVDKRIAAYLALVAIFIGSRQIGLMAQLFQTTLEAYRNDVLTANRMYDDICEVAGKKSLEDRLIIFTGERDAGLAGNAIRGELIGMSFFEADSNEAAGVSGRVGNLFQILGLELKELSARDVEAYREAVLYMEDAPSWPQNGSIQWMDEAIIVKLSD